MENVWAKRHLKRKLFLMPTSMTEDRELEFEEIEGRRIPYLIQYWYTHMKQGSISVAEHRAICAIILYQFETAGTM